MRDARRIAGLLVDMARRAGTRKAVLAMATSLAAGAAAVSVSWWLKLILDGSARGDLDRVTVLAAVLGTTVTLQAAASSLSGFYMADLQFACGVLVVRGIMQAAGGSPGIEHYERPEFADRIALIKQTTTTSPASFPSSPRGWPWPGG